MSDGEQPSPPVVLTKDELLLILDSTMASIASARMFIAKNMPANAVILDVPEGQCPHVNRAPSYPAFCLDCEQEVGVSAESPGGGGS